MTPRVFTIPASAPFLPTLIEALHDGKLGFDFAGDPLMLASATLYLPTRRACRLMRDAFLDRLHGDGAILPRIIAIGDIDEDEIAFAESAAGGIAADALALPPALGGLERRLLLTRLVLAWAQSPEVRGASGTPLVAQTPAAACALADDLARLIDDMTTRNVSWERLDELVPGEFDEYWQLTLRFLRIARKNWPQVLDEIGLDRSSGTPRRFNQGRGGTAVAQIRRASDCCRLDRIDPGHCRLDRDRRATAAWCSRPARTGHRSRPGELAADRGRRKERPCCGTGTSAICHGGAVEPDRHRPRRGCRISTGARSRTTDLGSPAAGRRNGSMAAQCQRCGMRSTNRRRTVELDDDRGRPSGRRGARDRGSAARGRAGEQDGRFGYAGSAIGPPRRRGAWPLGYRG